MTFTLAHGFALSLALHSAVLLPFVITLDTEPPEEPPVLVVELQGLVSDTQSQQQVQQQTKGAPEQKPQEEAKPTPPAQATQAAQAPTPPEPQQDVAEDGTMAVPPPPTPEQKAQEAKDAPPPAPSAAPVAAQSGNPGAANIVGAQEQRQAQTISREQEEAERLRRYVKELTKKVQENLVYPDAGRKAGLKGTARVAFKLEPDGTIRPGSLKIAESSGRATLDASALKTVEASVPFGPPPRPIGVAIAVTYGRKK